MFDDNEVFGFIQDKEVDKDTMHTMLQAAGFAPGIGNVADAADALLYLSEGKIGEASLSALAMLPIVGQYIAGRRAVKAAKKSGEEFVKVYRGVVDVADPNTMVKGKNVVGTFTRGKNFGPDIKRGNELYRRFDGITVPHPNNPNSGIEMLATVPRNVPIDDLMFTTTKFDNAKAYAFRYDRKKSGLVLEFDVPKKYIDEFARFADGTDVSKLGGYNNRADWAFWKDHPNFVWTDGLPYDFLTKVHKF